jgi:hypothetical protein
MSAQEQPTAEDRLTAREVVRQVELWNYPAEFGVNGELYIRKDVAQREYDRIGKERDQYMQIAEINKRTIEEMQKARK